jgi:LacI family transcriptional regulator
MTSIRDVALKAGVSTATVSHVLNKTRPVLPETRELVEQAVRSLHYRPNALARGLQTNRTRTVGVIVANIASFFFAQLVREIESVLEAEHYNLILCNTDEQPDRERRYLETLYEKRVDGLIIVPTGAEQPVLKQYAAAGIPVVSVYRKPGIAYGPVVMTDEFASGYAAARYLIARGHRRIGVLGRGHNLTPLIYRTQGYMHALRDHNIAIDQRLIEINYRAPERTADSARRLFSHTSPISAVISMSLSTTLGLLNAMRQIGVRYPEDVSVLGIGDAPWMEVLPAPLTVMAAPTREMARMATAQALAAIERAGRKRAGRLEVEPGDTSLLHAHLIERASCTDFNAPVNAAARVATSSAQEVPSAI